MKTWEMIKELTENPKKKFESTDAFGDKMIVFIQKKHSDNCRAYEDVILAKYVNDDIEPVILNGFFQNREWEEVKEPVTFMEAVMSRKWIKVDHEYIYDNLSFLKDQYNSLDSFLWNLGEKLGPESVRLVLTKGKFYIED